MGKRKSKLPSRLLQGMKRPNVAAPVKTAIGVAKPAHDLNGSRFRWLNESLYTESSSVSFELFQKDPKLFGAYHSGFRSQATSWPVNPVDEICTYIRTKHADMSVIGDFGCGDAQVSKTLNKTMTVHSFDLVSVNPLVTACNIANVPLEDSVLDVAIFSLSLMGTDWPKFVSEAQRCLKVGGILYISEVQSRVTDFRRFCDSFKPAFRIIKTDNSEKKYFVTVVLKKINNTSLTIDPELLKPCLYKKR
jgi:ribosomal RNA-processing protein 8